MSRPRQPDGRVHGVIVACRRDDGRLLCIRRSPLVAAPNKVCFPGGAIEAGESQTDAAIREMQEELGLNVRPIAMVWHWNNPHSDLTLWGWTADFDPQPVKPHKTEVSEFFWLTPEEVVEHPDAMPSNRSFVEALVRAYEEGAASAG